MTRNFCWISLTLSVSIVNLELLKSTWIPIILTNILGGAHTENVGKDYPQKPVLGLKIQNWITVKFYRSPIAGQ